VIRLREAIASGATEGPRILAAGQWVGTKNGVCDFNGIGVAGGPDAFRERVRASVAAGADLVKVCVTGWPVDADREPAAYEIADDSLAAAVAEARRHGRLVIAHAISLGGVNAAQRAGVNGFAHAAYVDSAAAKQLRRSGAFVIPTLASLLPATPGPAGARLQQAIKLAHREGVRLVFGTDGGVLPHGQNAREFIALTEAGVPAIDAIRAATINAAETLGLRGSIGGITPGATADIIAIDGDPLGDIGALSRVRFVMREGKVSFSAPTKASNEGTSIRD
jgi:imidazolonepropionase-like amidohydrolase